MKQEDVKTLVHILYISLRKHPRSSTEDMIRASVKNALDDIVKAELDSLNNQDLGDSISLLEKAIAIIGIDPRERFRFDADCIKPLMQLCQTVKEHLRPITATERLTESKGYAFAQIATLQTHLSLMRACEERLSSEKPRPSQDLVNLMNQSLIGLRLELMKSLLYIPPVLSGKNPQESGTSSRLIRRQLMRPAIKVPATITIAQYIRAYHFIWILKYGADGNIAQMYPLWNEVAPDLGRLFRFEYERWHTTIYGNTVRERERTVRPTVGQRSSAALKWSIRRLYGMIAGYGLKGGRFALTAFGIMIAFAVAYCMFPLILPSDLIMCPTNRAIGFSFQSVIWSIESSITSLTTIGPDLSCDGLWFSSIRALESIIGYFLLGILVSLLLQGFFPTISVPGGKYDQEAFDEETVVPR